jgi:hypothetical protein
VESRPSVFTLSPPVYVVTSPTVIVKPTVTKTIKKRPPPKQIKLLPAVYGLHTKLRHTAKGGYVLLVTFRLRRPVTIGLAVLHGKRVVSRTRLERFSGHTGELSVRVSRKAWPTGLKLLSPPS